MSRQNKNRHTLGKERKQHKKANGFLGSPDFEEIIDEIGDNQFSACKTDNDFGVLIKRNQRDKVPSNVRPHFDKITLYIDRRSTAHDKKKVDKTIAALIKKMEKEVKWTAEYRKDVDLDSAIVFSPLPQPGLDALRALMQALSQLE